MKQIPLKTSLLSFDTILEKAKLTEAQTVADFGCGNALFFLYALLTLVGKKGKVYAIDVLPEIIETVKREIRHHDLSGIIPLQANIDFKAGIPLVEKSLDRGFLINTLHQASDSLSMLKEAGRLIAPKGRLIVVDWETKASPIGPHPSRRLSAQAAAEAAEISGLTILEKFSAGKYHYGLILGK